MGRGVYVVPGGLFLAPFGVTGSAEGEHEQVGIYMYVAPLPLHVLASV
jgi:hypothetical protein